jgi:carboxypeptidase Taq
MSATPTYELLLAEARQTVMLRSIQGLLEWDERTYMPVAAGSYRADQVAYLAGEIHRRQTSPRIGDWLAELAGGPLANDPASDTAVTIRELQREYDKKTRLPQSLVEELSRLSVLGQQSWSEARQANDFAGFAPMLNKTFELKRQEAAALGYEATPYDPLLDDYEPGESTANVARVLDALGAQLRPLIAEIAASPQRHDASLLARDYPIAAQREFGKAAAAAIGFDFTAGRLDVTDHPFCAGAGPHDVRITTRYRPDDFGDAFFSILHEAGHGLYEQGLPAEHYGLPLGVAASLGIHESQSRMWENQVGRSRGFWTAMFPAAQRAFPQALSGASLEEFYQAINVVEPSLIRVDADEVTYNMHIFIRFELERALLEGDLPVDDLPGAWREKYASYLGITPADDAQGVLQDVHWGAGLVGYFPTYALGNLYAAQFYAQAESDLGPLEPALARGEFAPLLEWLRQHLHRHGLRHSAAQLVERTTGAPLTPDAWIAQMRGKYGELYGL